MADVLVIGGDRLLGAEVARAARAAGFATATSAAGAPADADALDRLVADLRPRAVVDASDPAAPHAAQAARAAARIGALSVIISGAGVFDGALDRPYVESDVPAPATPEGAARLAAERAVAHGNERHVIVRTSWVLGLSGPPLEKLIAAGRVAREVVVDAQTRGTPMLASEVADAVVALVDAGRYGVFHPGGGGSCTPLELARVTFRALGLPARAVAAPERPGASRQEALDTRRSGTPGLRDWRLAAASFAETLVRPPGRDALALS